MSANQAGITQTGSQPMSRMRIDCSVKVATPKKTIAAIIAQLLVRSSGRIAPGDVLRSTAIAIAKQIAVITIASATVARKKCNRPSRAFKPKTKPSIGAPFLAPHAQR